MANQQRFKLNTSITDFAPLFFDLEYLFKGLKETGIDGIELVIGVKSRWSVAKIKYLSKKYSLPIASIHQPVWAGLDIYFDKNFFAIAQQVGATTVTCHPLPRFSLQDKGMHDYLKKLAQLQNDTGLKILLENLCPVYGMKLVDAFFPLHKTTTDTEKISALAHEYGLQMTLDIDHLHKAVPQKEPWFDSIFPTIANIHLSSFTATKEHLPLYQGDFQAKTFLQYLKKHNYNGLLTFEVYYPGFMNFFGYDFTAIKKSVEFLKSSL